MPRFTQQQMDTILTAPHVARLWFAEVSLPDGLRSYHNGVGRVTAGDHQWIGVTDPSGQVVAVNTIQNVRFGQASVVTIVIAGANAAFFKYMYDEARAIEGRPARIYMAIFDQETEEPGPLHLIFDGRLSRPVIHRQGIGVRYVTVNTEDRWQSQNYPFGGKWSDADQQRRYPGDKGLQYVGVTVKEQFK